MSKSAAGPREMRGLSDEMNYCRILTLNTEPMAVALSLSASDMPALIATSVYLDFSICICEKGNQTRHSNPVESTSNMNIRVDIHYTTKNEGKDDRECKCHEK